MTKPHGDYTEDQLDAIWVAYQTQGSASCPYCGKELSFDLEADRTEIDMPPEVALHCSGCGRQDRFTPSDRNDSEQNPV